MTYKILEQNGIEIENVDGAAFNNFVIAGKNCILKGVLDECKIIKTSSNSFIISKGVMIIQGVRVKILEEQLFTLSSLPAITDDYQIVAQIEIKGNKDVSFELYVALKTSNLLENQLFKSEYGVYQVEVGSFTYTTNGVIENLKTSLPVAHGTPETIGKPVDGLTVVQDEEGNNLLYLTFEGKTVGEGIPIPQGGGGGGGGNNALLKVSNTTGWLSKTIAEGGEVDISLNWSSVEDGIPTGNGTLKIIVGNTIKNSYEVAQGDVFVDITKYLSVGSNDIKIEISDVYGNSRKISYTINSVSISLSSYFDGKTAYTGDIRFSYTPVGAVEKTIQFLIDNKSIGTQTVTTSGREQTFTIPAQSHGSHSLEVYFTATIDKQFVESNHLYYDLICYETGNDTPIISVPEKFNFIKQFTALAIPYIVYTPNSLTSEVSLKDGDNVISNLTVDRTKQIWSYKTLNTGKANLSIISGNTTKTISFDVTENKINVSAETENLELYLTSEGRSNNENNPLTWSFGDVSTQFTNFNLTSDGWKLDENNNTVLRVAGDARVYIPFNIFGSDFRTTGKTIEFEFATRNVLNYDTEIITAWSGERGIKITAQKALLKSEQSELFTQYKENEIVRIAFTVEKRAENRLLAIYINGIMSGVVQYAEDDDFEQSTPVGISIGSNYCTTDIYCIRVYSNNLTRYQILDNWIADTQDLTQLVERYERNNIFDDYGNITISKIPSYLPYMVLNVQNYSDLPQSKDDVKVISGSYIDNLNKERSFTFTGAEIDVQGTSSQFYARKNYKIKFKQGFLVGDSTNLNYQLRPTSIPTNEFTFKADVASSEGANNVELVRLYDDTCPAKTPPQQTDSRVRQGIEGYPILMFYGDTNNLKFLGKYNFNNDKSTPEVFGLKDGDESWEVLQNNTEMVIWKDDDFSDNKWKTSFEARYPKNNTNITKLKEFSSWLKSTDTTAVYTEYEKQERIQKFKTEFAIYANVDAMLFNYIFTEMFLMVDNRAKNAFPTIYNEENRWYILPYDYDTAIGINNEGELKFGYELEDTDLINGNNVFNGQDSVLYVNMRLAFADEIKQMYKDLRTGDIFSYEEIEKRFEEHQKVWGEAVFNEDAKFKYIEPLVNDGNSTYLPMLQGAKAEQRKWWLYNRFRYLDSKYNAGDALEDFITLRSYAVADIQVTPYADIYATALFDSALVQKRALRGNSYTLENPLSGGRDAVISIYSASQLSAIGDLSGLKVGLADFSKATKLSQLKVGDSSVGYDNPNLTSLTIGNLTLLKKLDVRNCSALTQTVDVSGCVNIEEVYLDGTATAGVTLPNGGMLKTLHLPSTVTNLTILNQKQITDFVLPSYENISTLRIENTPIVDTLSIINTMASNSRVRLVGVDWSMNNASEVLAVMNKLDTFRGLDENGNNTDKVVVGGKIYVPSLTAEELAEMNTRYPNIVINYDNLTVKVSFYNGDTLIDAQWLVKGATITPPENPTKESTVQYVYTFAGWSLDGVNVVELGTVGEDNVTYYAVFTEETRKYTVRFLDNDGSVLQESLVAYGDTPTYTGDTPVDETDEEAEFNGWSPAITAVTGDIDYTATYYVPPRFNYSLINNDTAYSVTGIGTVTDTDIVIPSTYKGLPVTEIGSRAFANNKTITSVHIPDSVTIIKNSALSYCKGLTEITIPEGVKRIGMNAFYACSNLEKVVWNAEECVSDIASVDMTVFEYCSKLTNIIIGNNVKKLPNCVFSDVTNLASIIIPEGVVEIGHHAFANCKNLVSVEIPNSVTTIENGVFSECKNLPSIVIPNSVTTVGTNVFSLCSKLYDIYYEGDIESYLSINGYKNLNAFTSYRNLYINNELVENITIPNSISSLEGYAFYGCSSLAEVTMHDEITSIGASAFEKCTGLISVTVPAATPPTAGIGIFNYCSALQTIYVPSESVEAYKSATNWSDYASKIQAIQ